LYAGTVALASVTGIRFRLAVTIWGADFARMFTQFSLPSLLADGNIPALTAKAPTVFSLFCDASAQRMLLECALFHDLKAIVTCEFRVFDPSEIDTTHFGSHWVLWRRGIDLARSHREILLFIIPDWIYSDGTLRSWHTLVAKGARAIFMPAPQVCLETVQRDVLPRYTDARGVVAIAQPDLVRTVLDHLHPLHIAMFRDSPRNVPHPEYSVRAANGAGLVIREITSQPFCFDPNHFDLSDSACPTNRLEDCTFDEIRTASVEPILKHPHYYYHKWHWDSDRLSNIGAWASHFCHPSNVYESGVNFVLRTAGCSVAEIQKCGTESDFFITQFWAIRSIYRLWLALQQLGCITAAGLLAAAHYDARLRRQVLVRTPATLFIPAESSFQQADVLLAQLLAPHAERSLISTLKQHVALGRITLRRDDCIVVVADKGDKSAPDHSTISSVPMASGARIYFGPAEELAVARIKGKRIEIINGPIDVDEFCVYVIGAPIVATVTSTPPIVRPRKFMREAVTRLPARHSASNAQTARPEDAKWP
jgi:hypothetical protein